MLKELFKTRRARYNYDVLLTCVLAALAIDAKKAERLTQLKGCECSPTITPDGKTVIFEGVLENGFGVFALDMATRRQTALSLQNQEVWEQQDIWDYSPVVSPDGKRIAYLRDDQVGTSVRVMGIGGDKDGIVNLGEGGEGDPVWLDATTVVATQPNNEIAEFRLAGTSFKRKVLGTIDAAYHPYGVMPLPDGRVVVRAAVEGSQLREWKLFALVNGRAVALAGQTPALRFKGQFATRDKKAMYLVTGYARDNSALALWPVSGGLPRQLAAMPVTHGMDVLPQRDGIVWSDCYEYAVLVRFQKGLPPQELTPRWPDVQLRWLHGASVSALGMGASEVRVLDLATRKVTVSPFGNVSQVVYSADGKYAAFARHDGVKVSGLVVRDLANGKEQVLTTSMLDHSPAWYGGDLYFMRGALTAEGSLLMRVSLAGGSPKELGFEPATAFVVSKEGLIFAGAKSKALMRAPHGGKPAPLLKEGGNGYFPDLKLSADEKRLLLLRSGKEVLELVIGTQSMTLVADAGDLGLRSIDYAPDGSGVIAAARRWEGDLWLSKLPVP